MKRSRFAATRLMLTASLDIQTFVVFFCLWIFSLPRNAYKVAQPHKATILCLLYFEMQRTHTLSMKRFDVAFPRVSVFVLHRFSYFSQ